MEAYKIKTAKGNCYSLEGSVKKKGVTVGRHNQLRKKNLEAMENPDEKGMGQRRCNGGYRLGEGEYRRNGNS